MLVTSVFTYIVPSTGKVGEVAPDAPIRCGCADLILILKDLSLLSANKYGILLTRVIRVVISSTPVPYVDPTSGENISVWKYDYTLEYSDADLTDPAYRIRKCDVLYNCCYGCAQAYTDRKLRGYVESVTGTYVDNTDPQNPVVNVPVFGCTQARGCFSGVDTPTVDYVYTSGGGTHAANVKISTTADNQLSVVGNGLYVPLPAASPGGTLVDNGDRTFTYTPTSGGPVSWCQGFVTLNQGGGCDSVGSNFMIKTAEVVGCDLRITGAAEHTSIAAHSFTVSGDSGQKAEGQSFTGSTHTTIFNNPSACRNMGLIVIEQVEFNLGEVINTANANAQAFANVEHQIRDGIGNTFPMANLYYIPANVGANKIGYFITKPTNAYTVSPLGSVTINTIPYFNVSKTDDSDVRVDFNGSTARTLLIASTVQ